jgi:hypothetical protein
MEGELVFLQIAKEKSQDAIRQARHGFYTYMMERGFKVDLTLEEKEAKAKRAKAQAEAEQTSYIWWAWGKLPDIDGEAAWNWFTSGLFGAVSGVMDKPGALADLVSTHDTEMTKAYFGLELMIRLRMRGYLFVRPDVVPPLRAGMPATENKPIIRELTAQQILQAIPLRDTRGDLYTKERADEVIQCLRAAMQLPEVQALMKNDTLALKFGIEKNYWNPNDIGDTWIEYIGDITSVGNLIFMFLPVAVAGKIPGGIYWGAEELWQLEKAEQFGHVITGTEAAARMLGWGKVITMLGKWEQGRETVLKLLKGYEDYTRAKEWWEKGARFGVADQLIHGVGKLIALLYFQYHVDEYAKEKGGPAAALAADFALFFVTDVEALTKFFEGRQSLSETDRRCAPNESQAAGYIGQTHRSNR